MEYKSKLAPGVSLLSETDDAHVTQSTPLGLKRKELEDADGLIAPDTNQARAKSTAQLRRDKNVRPV